MKTAFFLARRYLRPRRNAVSIITLISILGVTLGVAVLIIVLAVMTGFTNLMQDKLLQTQAHLQIYSGYSNYIARPQEIRKLLESDQVESAAVIMKPVMMQKQRMLKPKNVFAVNPEDVAKRMNLSTVIQRGNFSLEPGEIVISSATAGEFNLTLGEKILLHSQERLTNMFKIDDQGGVQFNDTEVYLPMEFKISGIFSFDKNDFDRSFVFINSDDAAELFALPPGSATQILGWVADPMKIDQTKAALAKSLPYMYISTWKESNQQLLDVLQMEKHMMFFLLIFIVLVAAFSITNTLITSVYQKTREIGVLKSLGASSSEVMGIFVFQGMFVGAVGSVCGFLLGWTVISWRNEIIALVSRLFQRDLFPKEFYFFGQMPAEIVAGDVMFIIVISIVLCTLGGLIPAYRAARLDPAKALRYE